jgi:hypothetical protein
MCVNELLVQLAVRSYLGCQPEHLVDIDTELCFAVVGFFYARSQNCERPL